MEEGNLTEVRENLECMGSSLPEAFCRMAVRRLEAVGYMQWDAVGLWNLAFSIRKAEQEVLDYCHIDAVPKGLYPMFCDRSCGHFLYGLKQSGRLEIEGIDLSGILTSLSEGDVKVDFDKGASDEARMDALLGVMMQSGKEQLKCYRRAQVLKARRAIERMYTGTCTVTEHQKVKGGASKLVTYADSVVLEGQPCRLSFKQSNPAQQTESAASIAQVIKLFLAPEATVRPGSKVTVSQDGVTADYKCSGVPAVYSTHQEIVLELFERWA